jgi:shikimate dehydrogenase
MTDPIRLGIFGWPVAHSKSPQMHEAAARALGLELRYERFGVAPAGLQESVRQQHEAAIDGYNLTVPHKEAIMTLVDEVAPTAQAIGAVNTVVRTDGRYVGHNTDAPGLVRSLEEAGVRLAEARVVVLGAGGAARAAVVGLSRAGAEEVTVLSRRPEQSEALCNSLAKQVDCKLGAAPLSEASWYFETATLLVQATSATLESNAGAADFAAALPIDALPAEAAVLDMVYKPLKTPVLARAEQRGLAIVDGLGMLLHQGAIAFEMWTDRFDGRRDVSFAELLAQVDLDGAAKSRHGRVVVLVLEWVLERRTELLDHHEAEADHDDGENLDGPDVPVGAEKRDRDRDGAEPHEAPRNETNLVRERGLLDALAAALGVVETIECRVELHQQHLLGSVGADHLGKSLRLRVIEARRLVHVALELAQLVGAQEWRELLPCALLSQREA